VPGYYSNYNFDNYQPLSTATTYATYEAPKKSEPPVVLEEKPGEVKSSSAFVFTSNQPLSDLDARINAVLAMSRETV